MDLVLFAQNPDVLSGGAGWVGAGLLGLVLGWLLLVYLPAKDKQNKEQSDAKDAIILELVDKKDGQISAILTQKWAALKEMGLEFKNSLEKVTEHCELEMKNMTEFWSRQIEEIKRK